MADHHADFDIDRAMELAKDYANATGMECLILLTDEKGILKPCTCQGHEFLCYQMDGSVRKGCVETHMYGAAHSKNTKQVFTYFCPIGLIHWAVPIVAKDQLQGALIGGHAFLNKARVEIAQLKSLSEKHNKLIKKYPELKKSLIASPVIDQEKMESLKNILSLMAESLSDTEQGMPEIKAHWDALIEKEKAVSSLEREKDKRWQQILLKLKSGKILETESALQEILTDIQEEDEPLENTKSRLSILLVSLFEPKEEEEEDLYLSEMALKAIQIMEPISDREKLIRWVEKNMRRILETGAYLPSIKHADMIYKALSYIEENYSQHIGLQEIADHVHFSPPYFSKIFKNEMNMTFTQYLTTVRIEESKKLLEDKTIPLSDIPTMVGFEEQSYFSKVFRISTGTSPGRFRESL